MHDNLSMASLLYRMLYSELYLSSEDKFNLSLYINDRYSSGSTNIPIPFMYILFIYVEDSTNKAKEPDRRMKINYI
jgi:hypothetical protein